jgi:hypothetical protein
MSEPPKMKEFKPLKESEIRKLLKGHQDVLTPMAIKEEAFFRASRCPACGSGGCVPFVEASRPFVPGNPLPNRFLQCPSCQVEFNPYTGLITRAPTAEPG